jgi:hypothetical protein
MGGGIVIQGDPITAPTDNLPVFNDYSAKRSTMMGVNRFFGKVNGSLYKLFFHHNVQWAQGWCQ